MKIKGKELSYLHDRVNDAMANMDKNELETFYADKSKTRFRFDMFYKSGVRIGDGAGLSGDIDIQGCNDSHIETAMKRILDSKCMSHIGKG